MVDCITFNQSQPRSPVSKLRTLLGAFALLLVSVCGASASDIDNPGGGISFFGSVTAGNCVQIHSTTQLADAGAPCGSGGSITQLSITPSITISGSFGGANSGIYDVTTLSGTSTGTSTLFTGQGFEQPKNYFGCPVDSADTHSFTFSGHTFGADSSCVFVYAPLGGGSQVGGRSGLTVTVDATSNPTSGVSSYFYPAIVSNMTVAANFGGTGAGANSAGEFYGYASQAFIQSGSSWIGSLFNELDVGAACATAHCPAGDGSGVPYWLAGLLLVSWNTQQGQAGISPAHGSNRDVGLWLSTQAGAIGSGFRDGIYFDTATSGIQAIWNGDGLGTFIYTDAAAVFRVLDFGNATCSGSGSDYFLFGSVSLLDCSGNLTVNNMVFSGTLVTQNASLVIDGGGNGAMFQVTIPGPSTPITDYLCITDAAAANPSTLQLAACGSDTNRNINIVTNGTGILEINGVQAPTLNQNNTFTGSTNTFNNGVYLAGVVEIGSGLWLANTDAWEPHGFDGSSDRGAFALICANSTCTPTTATQTAEPYIYGSTAATPTTVEYSVIGTATDIYLKLQPQGAGLVLLGSAINLPCVPFASHGTALNGDIECFSNSSVNAWGGTADGVGADQVLAWYNGSLWTVIGK